MARTPSPATRRWTGTVFIGGNQSAATGGWLLRGYGDSGSTFNTVATTTTFEGTSTDIASGKSGANRQQFRERRIPVPNTPRQWQRHERRFALHRPRGHAQRRRLMDAERHRHRLHPGRRARRSERDPRRIVHLYFRPVPAQQQADPRTR